MTAVYTYTDARQNFASLLERAAVEGEVRVRRRDGQVFVIKPVETSASPLDIDGLDLNISADEIVQYIAESRRYPLPDEDDVRQRFDEMLVRLAENNAEYSVEEVAAEVAAAIAEVRAQDETTK